MLRCFWFFSGPGIWRSLWIPGRAWHGCSVSPLHVVFMSPARTIKVMLIRRNKTYIDRYIYYKKKQIKLVASWPMVRPQNLTRWRWSRQMKLPVTNQMDKARESGKPGKPGKPVPRCDKWKIAGGSRRRMVVTLHGCFGFCLFTPFLLLQCVAMNNCVFLICLFYTQLNSNTQICIRHGMKMALSLHHAHIHIVSKLSEKVCQFCMLEAWKHHVRRVWWIDHVALCSNNGTTLLHPIHVNPLRANTRTFAAPTRRVRHQ